MPKGKSIGNRGRARGDTPARRRSSDRSRTATSRARRSSAARGRSSRSSRAAASGSAPPTSAISPRRRRRPNARSCGAGWTRAAAASAAVRTLRLDPVRRRHRRRLAFLGRPGQRPPRTRRRLFPGFAHRDPRGPSHRFARRLRRRRAGRIPPQPRRALPGPRPQPPRRHPRHRAHLPGQGAGNRAGNRGTGRKVGESDRSKAADGFPLRRRCGRMLDMYANSYCRFGFAYYYKNKTVSSKR